MYKIKVNDQFSFETEIKEESVLLNQKELKIDWVNLGQNKFHMLLNHQSYSAELIAFDGELKKVTIKVNNGIYDLEIRDQFDELLKNLGLDNLNTQKIKEIKAPMPGLVLKILVKEGDVVKKGENLLILEAMKMENMIKAPADFQIKRIAIKAGDKVEKNQVMLALE